LFPGIVAKTKTGFTGEATCCSLLCAVARNRGCDKYWFDRRGHPAAHCYVMLPGIGAVTRTGLTGEATCSSLLCDVARNRGCDKDRFDRRGCLLLIVMCCLQE